MSNTMIFYTFTFIMFFILIRESIIDIKTQFVSDNITIAAYATSITYVIVNMAMNHSLNPLKQGGLGFIVGFGCPFALSYITYLIQKIKYKAYKKKLEKSGLKPEEIETEAIIYESQTLRKIKKYIYYTLCVAFVIFIAIVGRSYIPTMITIPLGLLTVISSIIIYNKTKKIDGVFYILAFVMTAILTIFLKVGVNPLYAIIGFSIEYALYFLFKRFDNLEELLKEEKEELEKMESEEEAIYGGIGGGDIMLFGALGLMYGPTLIVLILLYSCFAQMLVIISYYLLLDKNDFASHIPFVPGITLATFLVVNGFDFCNIKILIMLLSGGY